MTSIQLDQLLKGSWRVFLRSAQQECDRNPSQLRLDVLGDGESNAQIADPATGTLMASLALDLSTRTIKYTDPQGLGFFSLEEDGAKLADRRTKVPLLANEAANAFVRRLMASVETTQGIQA
jgi:hypothetical protein